MRLISKKSVLRILQEEPSYYDTQNAITEIYDKINELPTIEERKTGRWISSYGNVKCSVCGKVYDCREVGKATHYCSFCGAEMKGGAE